ncbi:MAG: c-type cytochrome [Burkholderiales bacterium]
MKAAILAIAAAAIVVVGGANAQSGAEVVKAKGCMNCHDMETKKVGPAFKEIAAKYKGNKEASAMLAAKLKEGKGHMKIAATDAEISSALQYVLSAK